MQYKFGKRLVSIKSSEWLIRDVKGLVKFQGGHVHPMEALKILQREMPEYRIDNVVMSTGYSEAKFLCRKKTAIDIMGDSIENSC